MLQQTAQGSLKACALSDETSFAQERGKRGQVLQCSNFKKKVEDCSIARPDSIHGL
jgi:hypothetical protein